MRPDVTESLDIMQNSPVRYPLARVTARNWRLRFDLFASQDNPWSYDNDEQVNTQDYVFGDNLVLDNGTILRVWADQTGPLYLQVITNPTDPDEWNHTDNPWVDSGVNPNVGIGVGNPGIVRVNGTTGRVFYDSSDDEGGDIGLHYRNVTASGWGSANQTGINIFGTSAYAPVSDAEVFAYVTSIGGIPSQMGFYRIYFDGTWLTEAAPFRVLSDRDHFVNYNEYNSITFFDAFVLNGITHVVYSFGDAGRSFVFRYQNGIWSEPRELIPDDASKFVVYRASVLGSRVYITGRLSRDNDPNFSPAFDCYLMSEDGVNFSAMARESFLCEPEVRGQMLKSGAYVYYPGVASVWRAPVTYQVGTDDGNQLVLDDEILQMTVTFPSSGLAPSINLDLANADDALTDIIALRDSCELWVEAGYKTNAGDEYIDLLQASIDSNAASHQDGEHGLTLSGRSSAVKALHDWSSPFYWTLQSQIRFYDPCDNFNSLNIVRGEWENTSDNLIENWSFEEDLTDWDDDDTGTADGTRTWSDEQASSGTHSYKIVKTAGDDQDRYGTKIAITAEAGFTYRITADIYVTAVSGSNLRWGITAIGNLGTEGSGLTDISYSEETTYTFYESSMDVKVEVGGTLEFAIGFVDATTGTMYIDNVQVVKKEVGFLRFKDQTLEGEEVGLLVSVTPFTAGDFDIQATFTNRYSVKGRMVAMGLLFQYVDENNYNYIRMNTQTNRCNFGVTRGGTAHLIASEDLTLVESVAYNLRIIHRGGKFWVYVKSNTVSWLDPIIEMRWPDAKVMCATNDGRGSVGVCIAIRPFEFTIVAIDEASTSIVADQTGDIASFPASGTVFIEDEEMTYTSKTSTTLEGVTRGVNGSNNVPHEGGVYVHLLCDEEVEVDDFQYTDTEPNYTTEMLIQKVAGMAGVFTTEFQDAYPRPGLGDDTSITPPNIDPDYSAVFLAGVNNRNIDITFTWECDQWDEEGYASVGVILRASTTDMADTEGYIIFLGDLLASPVAAYWAGLFITDGAGGVDGLDQFELIQHPVGHGPHTMRILARDDFFAIYCNDSLMATFRDTTIPDTTLHNYVGIIGRGSPDVTNIHIAELHEWRETAWVDNEATAQAVIDSVIIDDRPIYMNVRGNNDVRWSLFDTRDIVTNPLTDGSFGHILYSDRKETQDGDRISWLRTYAITIMEAIDSDLAKEVGLLFAARQMPRAETLFAGQMFPRLFARSQEVHAARNEELPANLSMEVEDTFAVSFVPSGTSVETDATVIINDMEYTFTPGSFTMAIGLRGSTEDLVLAQAPIFLGKDCLLNLQADAGVMHDNYTTDGDGYVLRWLDQSSHGNNFYQTDTDLMPYGEVESDLRAVTFQSDGRWMSSRTAIADNLDSFTVIVVAKKPSSVTSATFISNLNVSTGWRLSERSAYIGGVDEDQYIIGLELTPPSYDTADYHIHAMSLVDRSTLEGFYDGVAYSLNFPGEVPIESYKSNLPLYLATEPSLYSPNFTHIRAVMIYSPALTTPQREQVEAWLTDRWDL